MSTAPTSAGREKRCGVCGHESRQPGFRPPVPEQAPDLDLRPGEPVRSTMARWLEACPHCGYAAPNIAEAHPAGAQAVAAAPYRALIADTAHPVLARRFLAWAHVLEETGALHAAAEATLHAAWVADDLNRDDLARQWRREAVALWRSGPALDAEQSVRVIDALRRAGDFAEAEGAAEALAALNPPEAVAQVTALEVRLIAAEDMGRHSIASALAPPARRPHVTHQKSPGAKKRPPEGGGLKSWLRRIFKG
jgi:hypothetical protein